MRELGLPRDALLNLIVRGDAGDPAARLDRRRGGRPPARARPPGGRASSSAKLLRRWRDGPIAQRPPRPVGTPRSVDLLDGPWHGDDGDPGRPERVTGMDVIDQLRTRRDVPGALVALADGRFAYTGPIQAIGSARQLQDAARQRLRERRRDAERAWWREVDRRARGRMGIAGLTSVLGRAYSRAPKDGIPHLLSCSPPRGEARG